MAYSRLGNLNPNSSSGKGYIFQLLTCKWLGVKDLNIENNNFAAPIDHSRNPELGTLQSKGAAYQKMYGFWSFSVENEEMKSFDNMIFYCTDKFMKILERVYIVPKKEVIKRRKRISIVKNPSKGFPWYEKYRLQDIQQINDIFKNIIENIENGKDPILRRI